MSRLPFDTRPLEMSAMPPADGLADKVNYMTSDITRWSRDFNIPWTSEWPENYPFKATTLKVQRVLTACSLECPERYPDLLAALYRAFWVDKKGVQLPGVYEPIVVSVLGEEAASSVIERVSPQIRPASHIHVGAFSMRHM
jgi:2-hydroxychromene-2-carboxylate isomerase